jgi:hypothetical protein
MKYSKTTTLRITLCIAFLFNLGWLSLALASTNPNPSDDKLPKPIAYDYSGYCVQLFESNKELGQEHRIFQHFGEIKIEEFEGKFYYYVGDFKSIASTEKYMKKVILSRYPNAIIARFSEGVRIDLDE